jgi:hypothetical protein
MHFSHPQPPLNLSRDEPIKSVPIFNFQISYFKLSYYLNNNYVDQLKILKFIYCLIQEPKTQSWRNSVPESAMNNRPSCPSPESTRETIPTRRSLLSEVAILKQLRPIDNITFLFKELVNIISIISRENNSMFLGCSGEAHIIWAIYLRPSMAKFANIA